MYKHYFTFEGRTLFIDLAESDAEDARLKDLALDVRSICRICEKTGLHVVHEFDWDGRNALVTVLREPLLLDPEGIKRLVLKCLEEKKT